MAIEIDDKIDKQFEKAFSSLVGDSLRQPVTMFLGNPAAEIGDSPLYANDEKTRVWICDNVDSPNTRTAIPIPNIPKSKLVYGTAVIVKDSVNGYVFQGLDTEYDSHFSEDDSQQISQQPIVLTQILYGTIQPAGAMSVTVKSAFYGALFVSDIVTGDVTTLLDTLAAPITLPTTNNRTKGLLIQLDPVAKTLSYKQSSEYIGNISLEQQVVAGNLPLADSDKKRIGYVQLYKGQFEIVYGDIFQAPEWIAGGDFSLGLDADVGSSQTLASGDTLDIRGDSSTVETELIGAGIIETRLMPSGVTPATYPIANVTVDTYGRATTVASGAPNTWGSWGAAPDGDLKFTGQYTDDSIWHFTGNEMRMPIAYTFTSSTGYALGAFDMALFDAATDLAITMTGTPLEGYRIIANAKQATLGTGHTLKLPSGVTWDGTNNTASFLTTASFLEAWAISATRYFLTANTVGVTFSIT